jgi:hypothetical protein
MPKLKANPEWLRANLKSSSTIGVDRENRIINGFIVAEAGPFRSQGRGEFDSQSLSSIVALMRAEPQGLKSRFAHPTLSSDGLGHYLGRAHTPRIETVSRNGKIVELVRADLHLSETAFDNNPNGNLGNYVLSLAEEDADAMGASLMIKADKEYRLDAKKRRMLDDNGNELPPIWRPMKLHAIDIVDTGDATRAFLGMEDLPDAIVRQGSALLDRQFAGCSREVVKARCNAWLESYLNTRYGLSGEDDDDEPGNVAEKIKIRRKIKARKKTYLE